MRKILTGRKNKSMKRRKKERKKDKEKERLVVIGSRQKDRKKARENDRERMTKGNTERKRIKE